MQTYILTPKQPLSNLFNHQSPGSRVRLAQPACQVVCLVVFDHIGVQDSTCMRLSQRFWSLNLLNEETWNKIHQITPSKIHQNSLVPELWWGVGQSHHNCANTTPSALKAHHSAVRQQVRYSQINPRHQSIHIVLHFCSDHWWLAFGVFLILFVVTHAACTWNLENFTCSSQWKRYSS